MYCLCIFIFSLTSISSPFLCILRITSHIYPPHHRFQIITLLFQCYLLTLFACLTQVQQYLRSQPAPALPHSTFVVRCCPSPLCSESIFKRLYRTEIGGFTKCRSCNKNLSKACIAFVFKMYLAMTRFAAFFIQPHKSVIVLIARNRKPDKQGLKTSQH